MAFLLLLLLLFEFRGSFFLEKDLPLFSSSLFFGRLFFSVSRLLESVEMCGYFYTKSGSLLSYPPNSFLSLPSTVLVGR
ncbi:hypothetical protein GGS21DRAFT_325554 [Xylaria nigripes]|nr:hypothetical protein GGS21DRAFT_325554 [Xylaria nigripes]